MKPTEALLYPTDWSTTTVGESIELRRGLSWSKDQEHQDPREGVMPIIRIGNVQERLELDDIIYISGLSQSTIAEKQATKGWSIIVGSNGNRSRVGNAVLVDDNIGYLFASFLVAARPKVESNIMPEFFYRWLMIDPIQGYLSASAEGSTGLNNLSHSFFKAMKIPVPPPEEQVAIAHIIDAVDTVIAQTQEAVTQAKVLKVALVQRLFSEGIRGEPQRKTVIGQIPTSWSVVPVKSVVRQFQYGLSMAMAAKGEYPILRMGNIQAGEVLLDDLKYVDLPQHVAQEYLLQRGDVVFNRTNSQEHVGKVGIYRSDTPVVFASYLIRLLPDNMQIDNFFLGQLLSSYAAQCRIKRYATPGVQQVNINAKNLGLVLIPVPLGKDGLDEQKEIAAILEQADDKIRSYTPFLDALHQLKIALTYDLLTGKVRTNNLNIDSIVGKVS